MKKKISKQLLCELFVELLFIIFFGVITYYLICNGCNIYACISMMLTILSIASFIHDCILIRKNII